MKYISLLILWSAAAYAVVTPNYPDGTPEWATGEDLEVAYVIMGESRGESLLGQSFVADCIHTRMVKRNMTAYEVITQPNQFKGYYTQEVTDHVWKLVLKLRLGVDIIKDAEYCQFRAYKLTSIPSWAKNPVVIGSHIFFEEGK